MLRSEQHDGLDVGEADSAFTGSSWQELLPPSSIEPGATLAELVARTGAAPTHLRAALVGELALGRVALSPDGRYRLVAEAFAPGVLDALRAFSAPATAELNGGRARAVGGRVSAQERAVLELPGIPGMGDGRAAR